MKRGTLIAAAVVCATALMMPSYAGEKGEKKKRSKSTSGKVVSVDAAKNTLTIEKGKKGEKGKKREKEQKTFTIPKGAAVKVNGEEGRLADVKSGMKVSIRFEEDDKTVKSVSAKNPKPKKAKARKKKKEKDEDDEGRDED